jgi:hypothetical protein
VLDFVANENAFTQDLKFNVVQPTLYLYLQVMLIKMNSEINKEENEGAKMSMRVQRERQIFSGW